MMRFLPAELHIFNGGAECDVEIGPCDCGATHNEYEWADRLNANGFHEIAAPDIAL